MTDLAKIKAFAFDIDGVATDGGVFCNGDGDLLRTYDAKDGFAIRMAVMHGYPVAVITGGSSESIRKRMVTSGVKAEDVFLHCRDKREQFAQFCSRYSLDPSEVMYFGDDVPDIDVLKACGCGVCPSDAVEEVKAVADWVSGRPGGKGCLRECIENALRTQGNWTFDPTLYKQKF
ncbi:MAG: HAD hydrolase family protein [Bacteroidales bacterium]|nr:HAD hydrolase family protein [Bacteroidales bacterium]